MSVAVSVKTHALSNVCLRRVVKTNPKDAKTECVLTEGNSTLVSNFVASFIRAGDELLFPLEHEAVDAGTQIYIRRPILRREGGTFFRPRSVTRHSPEKISAITSSFPLKFLTLSWEFRPSTFVVRP